MQDKDAKGAAAMIADDGLVTGPQGTMRMNPAKNQEMTREGTWTLDSFEMKAVDAWKCALHTETILENVAG